MCKQLGLAPGGPDDDDGVPAFLAKAMSAPHLKSVTNALELLVEIGAMYPESNALTVLGECLAVLSLEPRVGKMVLWSNLLGCARVASNMAVAMSYKSPFTLPRIAERQAADGAKVELSKDSESDQITVHNALEALEKLNRDSAVEAFCRRNFLGMSTMKMISDLRKNLARELASLGLPNPSTRNLFHNRHDNDHALWYAALAAGLYPNVAMRKKGDVNFSTMVNRKVKVHLSSVNAIRGQPFNSKSKIPEGEVEFVCFGEMVKGPQGTFTVDQTTRLPSPLPLLLLCGTSLRVEPHPDDHELSILSLDDWITFKCDVETAANIVVLRKRLESAFWNALSNPSAVNLTETEQDAVEIVGVVLQSTHIVNQCPI
jgi:Helicase associated domain (HA2)/Oligonucleotide/oligosaccharide-binding (OB)-fold